MRRNLLLPAWTSFTKELGPISTIYCNQQDSKCPVAQLTLEAAWQSQLSRDGELLTLVTQASLVRQARLSCIAVLYFCHGLCFH